MDEDDEDLNNHLCKIVMVGQAAVGKTCIMIRFMQDKFDPFQKSTVGASYADKSLKYNINNNEETVKFMIWDTSGMERYSALTRNFYADAKVAILVYDITNKSSFERGKEFWFKEIINNCPNDVILGLAGNKIDLYNQEEVSEDEARKFAESNHMIYYGTSALSGVGINDLFNDIGKKYLKKILNKKNYIKQENNNNKNNNSKNKNDSKSVKLQKMGKNKKKKKGCC